MQLLSAQDLWQMPGDNRRELLSGELVELPYLGYQHGVLCTNLATCLHEHAHKHRLGDVVATGTGFILARDPDTVRGAALAFVSAARLPDGERPESYFPGAPDLAVEVVSPNDTNAEVEDKVDDYLKAGARLVWVVKPRRRTVTVHRPAQPPTMLRDTDTLTGDDVVPGFACPVAEVFA